MKADDVTLLVRHSQKMHADACYCSYRSGQLFIQYFSLLFQGVTELLV